MLFVSVYYYLCEILRAIYTKRQHQCYHDTSDTALIEINGNKELIQNGVATHFGVTPLISMRAMPQAASER